MKEFSHPCCRLFTAKAYVLFWPIVGMNKEAFTSHYLIDCLVQSLLSQGKLPPFN